MPPKLPESVTVCNAREGSAGADPGIQERGSEAGGHDERGAQAYNGGLGTDDLKGTFSAFRFIIFIEHASLPYT